MKVFKLNWEYPYSIIHNQVNPDLNTVLEYGNVLIGEYFLVVKDIKTDNVCSFVLTGMTNKEALYKCVYNDFKSNE